MLRAELCWQFTFKDWSSCREVWPKTTNLSHQKKGCQDKAKHAGQAMGCACQLCQYLLTWKIVIHSTHSQLLMCFILSEYWCANAPKVMVLCKLVFITLSKVAPGPSSPSQFLVPISDFWTSILRSPLAQIVFRFGLCTHLHSASFSCDLIFLTSPFTALLGGGTLCKNHFPLFSFIGF